MPRRATRGTPSRSHQYLFPRSAHSLVVLAAVLGGVVILSLAAFEIGGRFASPLLRSPLMPGALVNQHSFGHCEACHDPLRGASVLRCQRCHDESGPGRMTHVAHVGRHYARVGDPAVPETGSGDVTCIRCHVEHQGGGSSLVRVDERQCVSCHGESRPGLGGHQPPRITSLENHPELALRVSQSPAPGKNEPPPKQATGFHFSHREHIQELRSTLPPGEQPGAAEGQLCASCHAIATGMGGVARDFTPLAAGNHCFRCHQHGKHLKVRAAPAGDLLAPLVAGATPTLLACDALPRDFRCVPGGIEKVVVTHKDPWVLLNVRKLRRELYPEDHTREVSHLREQELRLRRRLYLAQRLGGLSLEELQRRRQALAENVRDLTARLESRARNADDPRLGLSRVDEVAVALGADGAPLAELARTVGTPRLADADADFPGRRQEVVDLLDAVAARPDLEEGVRRRVDVLRARLFSLRPGEGSAAGLRRALAQREADLARVDDELKLRSDGVVPPAEPNTGLFQAAAALRQTQARLAELAVVESFPAVTEPAARERKQAALLALTGEDHASGCAKCHQVQRGSFSEPVRAAEPALTLSRFAHTRHLGAAYPPDWTVRLKMEPLPASETATAPPPGSPGRGPSLPRCAYCHGDVERSESSADLHLQPIADCRVCHRDGAQRSDCQLCHLYHPPNPRRL